METRENACLNLGIEIHDRVTADQQIEPRDRRVLGQIVTAENDRASQIGAKNITVIKRLKVFAVNPRVLPEARGHGVGRALLGRLIEHARALDVEGIVSYVNAGDERSIAFARRSGLDEVDYQLEQTRAIGAEAPPLAARRASRSSPSRDELLRAAYDAVGAQGYEDMPLSRSAWMPLDEWLRTEATRRGGSYVALRDGEIVGYAGMWEHANGYATAEHGLTAVRREHRRRGIATALKRTQLAWAARTACESSSPGRSAATSRCRS